MDVIVSTSPSDPSREVAEVEPTDPAAIHGMVAQARRAGASWARTGAAERASALRRLAQRVEDDAGTLRRLLVREVAKPGGEADEELKRSVELLHYFATQALDADGASFPPDPGADLLYTRRVPRGAVTVITPWNFPLAIPLWKAAPALTHGNAVLLKPSPFAVGIAARLAELAADVLPSGVFQAVYGDSEVGDELVRASDAVSFTGSTAVGRLIARNGAAHDVPVQAELGGNNPAIVLPDAPAGTAAMIARAAFAFGGQKCTATSRVIVVGDAEGFARDLAQAAAQLPSGDPADADTVIGPLISAEAVVRADRALAAAVEAGDQLVHRNDPVPGPGHHWPATVVLADSAESPLLAGEVFAPVVTVVAARDAEEALRLANSDEHGLAAGVYTADLAAGVRTAERLEAGMVKVNRPTTGVAYYAPFGGEKASGIGPREQGTAAREFFTTTRTITIGTTI